MVDLISINNALAVSEHLSFRGAASVIGVTQSAISHRVRALEDELGVSLFERHSGGVRITTAGQRFFDRARIALLNLDLAVRSAANAGRGVEGHLRIGVFASIASGFSHDLLAAYANDHPGVEISIAECAPREQMARIKERRLDVAFVTGDLIVPGLDVERLWSERVFVVLTADHPLAGDKEISWSSLRNERFIVSSDQPGPEIHDFIVKQLAQLGYQPVIEDHEVARETLMILVGLGFGLSLVSEAGAAPIYPSVVFRPVTGGEDVLSFSAVWSPDNDNPALRRFLSVARVMARSLKVSGAPL